MLFEQYLELHLNINKYYMLKTIWLANYLGMCFNEYKHDWGKGKRYR